MRTFLAMLAVLGTSQGAMANCLLQPDNAASAYVLNGMQQALCLGSELSSATALRNRAVEIDAATGSQQREQMQQKFETRFQPVWPAPSYPPAWL